MSILVPPFAAIRPESSIYPEISSLAWPLKLSEDEAEEPFKNEQTVDRKEPQKTSETAWRLQPAAGDRPGRFFLLPARPAKFFLAPDQAASGTQKTGRGHSEGGWDQLVWDLGAALQKKTHAHARRSRWLYLWPVGMPRLAYQLLKLSCADKGQNPKRTCAEFIAIVS